MALRAALETAAAVATLLTLAGVFALTVPSGTTGEADTENESEDQTHWKLL